MTVMQPHILGNVLHVISFVSVLAFGITAMLFAKPGSKFFDSEWVEDGFCIIQKDTPYWNSHDLCLYFDMILAAIGILIHQLLKGMSIPAMKDADQSIFFNMLGHLGHGLAHGFLAAQYRSDNDNYAGMQHISLIEKFLQEEDAHLMRMEILKHASMALLFWFAILKGVVPTISVSKLALSSILAYISGLFVTDVLTFAHIQLILSVSFSWSQLMLPMEKKDFSYAAFSVSSLIINIIPWIESTTCQGIAGQMGGHLIFDVSIPVSLIAAYCASWYHYYSVEKTTKEKVV